jgi:hypothetical protein
MGTRLPFRWLASEIEKTMPSSVLLRSIVMRTSLLKLAGEMSVPINFNFFLQLQSCHVLVSNARLLKWCCFLSVVR